MKFSLLLLVFVLTMACNTRVMESGKESIQPSDTVKKAVYRCPMKEDSALYDTAGVCPLCGMDLEKIK